MSDKKMVPEIRFKGFKEDWNEFSIEGLISKYFIEQPKDGNHGNIHPKSSDYVKNGIPFIMANNIKNGEIDYINCYHISKVQADSLQKGFAYEGDVLLTHKGTVGEVAVISKNSFPYIMLTPQVTYYRVLNKEKLHNLFIASAFLTSSFKSVLKEAAGGGTREYIGITEQQQLKLSFPLIKEQKKLGNFFKDLDSSITKHQQKYDKLITLKKAMLEKMFPKDGQDVPEMRFNRFSEIWTKTTFRNISVINQGLQIAISNRLTQKIDGSYFYITNEFLKEDTNYNYYILNPPESVKCSKNDILMTRTGNTGLVVTNVDGAFHNNFFKINFDRTQLDKTFLVYFLMLNKTQSRIIQLAGQSTIPDLNHGDFYKIEITFPKNKEEQIKIGNYFKKLDRLISLQRERIDKLKNIKKSCLDKMFV